MIRHKEIWSASLKYADEHPSDYTNEMYDIVDIEKAFKAGAEWAGSTMIKNGVIINGVTYEFASSEEIKGDDCMECALHGKCHEIGYTLCSMLFDDYIHEIFKRVE